MARSAACGLLLLCCLPHLRCFGRRAPETEAAAIDLRALGVQNAAGRTWPPPNLALWLASMGLGQYAGQADAEGMDGELLSMACCALPL